MFEHLDLHLTDRCNLSCTYCYLHQGKEIRRPDFPDGLITLMPTIVKRLGIRRITFYGGEPMLAFDRIRRIVEVVPQCRFGIVTNGTICSAEQSRFLREHQFSIQRSIDGGPEACQHHRPGIIEQYLQLTPLFADHGKPRRSTVTPGTVGCMYDSWKWLEDQGFDQGWTPIPDFYSEWTDEDINTFIEQMRLIGRDLVERVKAGKRPFYNYWFNRMKDVILQNRGETIAVNQSRGCGAGASLIALRQDGYFFACHRFVTDPPSSPWCLGHVNDVLAGRGLRPGLQARTCIERAKGKRIDYEIRACTQC